MLVLETPINKTELASIAANFYGDMVKAVADIDKEILAIDAEFHADLERELLNNGSDQESLWGFNLYPEADEEDFIEFDSLINIRPRQGNPSRDVEDPSRREKIVALTNKYIID